MSPIVRFGISINKGLAVAFDRWRVAKGYATRSQALAALIRDALIKQRWQRGHGKIVGIVSLVYDPTHHVLSHTLTRTEHAHHDQILSSQHIHLDERHCLEVVVLRGTPVKVRAVAQHLKALKGVQHAQFIMTTGGEAIP